MLQSIQEEEVRRDVKPKMEKQPPKMGRGTSTFWIFTNHIIHYLFNDSSWWTMYVYSTKFDPLR